jgi:ATP sulfurylase
MKNSNMNNTHNTVDINHLLHLYLYDMSQKIVAGRIDSKNPINNLAFPKWNTPCSIMLRLQGNEGNNAYSSNSGRVCHNA